MQLPSKAHVSPPTQLLLSFSAFPVRQPQVILRCHGGVRQEECEDPQDEGAPEGGQGEVMHVAKGAGRQNHPGGIYGPKIFTRYHEAKV